MIGKSIRKDEKCVCVYVRVYAQMRLRMRWKRATKKPKKGSAREVGK